MKKEIKDRKDLSLLVRSFYSKIRADKEIGPFFNETITDWEEHLEKLTDFWETSLFGGRKYQGNPLTAHVEVDKHFGNRISANEFGIWLNLWFETLDTHFEGANVDVLKQRARKMGTHLNIAIFSSRLPAENID
jgi:hemoglobin